MTTTGSTTHQVQIYEYINGQWTWTNDVITGSAEQCAIRKDYLLKHHQITARMVDATK